MHAILVLCLVAGAFASLPAAKYPAGVSPAACPNYPICDPFVDPTTGHARAYAGDNRYGYRAAAPLPYNHYNAYNALPYHAAPYNPYPAAHAGYAHAGYAHARYGKEYPAGVSPAACPNYPDCPVGFVANPYVPATKAH